ncbi:MAG: UDP-N-acetylmuramate--L-alanine ligase [Desulfovibrionales bacterium]|nr:UDP-N-acetylmuramate--L-alanine ligase [Desulfovibrionales bacterium]
MYKTGQHVHFVGIGGIGMSGIAEVLINLGYKVSGSDLAETDITRRLSRLGCTVHKGHDPQNVRGAAVLVTSSAVTRDNPEVQYAREAMIPVIPRAEMLAELMRLKYGIAVAGAHGKTTTTSMVATVLAQGGLDPTVVIGGKLNSLGSNAKLGQGKFLVAEADESDGSFMHLSPSIVVVTNVDVEHLDYYGNLECIKTTFLEFINKVPFYGIAIVCLDDNHIPSLIPYIKKRYATYGLSAQADFQARDVRWSGLGGRYIAYHLGQELGEINLNIPGIHNVYNSLAAVACGLELDIPFADIQTALQQFSGVQRRFQIKGEVSGIIFVDDYGHHPTEIKATLTAMRQCWEEKRLIVIFQPHRYTRTQALFEDFVKAFYQTDMLILTEIYAAGEKPIPGVEAKDLCESIRRQGHKDVQFIPDRAAIAAHLEAIVRPGDVVLTLGAGNIWQVGEELLTRLGK